MNSSRVLEPYLEIIEQPKQHGFRFRYSCEGQSHGGLPGITSRQTRKTYPTVKINNFTGKAKVRVQLVTSVDPPLLHAHSFVGKKVDESGSLTIDVGPHDMTAVLYGIGIEHVKKKVHSSVLEERWVFNKVRDQYSTMDISIKKAPAYLMDFELDQIKKKVQEEVNKINLNVVRIMFTALLPDSHGLYTTRLPPVYSLPIYDSKAPSSTVLQIVRMDRSSGSVVGGEEIYLLCDKVQKDDIKIRFFDVNGWEGFANFGPVDVHRQFAIVFKTPAYSNSEITSPVRVNVELVRQSDSMTSDAKHFTYYPKAEDKKEVARKRRKVHATYVNYLNNDLPLGNTTYFPIFDPMNNQVPAYHIPEQLFETIDWSSTEQPGIFTNPNNLVPESQQEYTVQTTCGQEAMNSYLNGQRMDMVDDIETDATPRFRELRLHSPEPVSSKAIGGQKMSPQKIDTTSSSLECLPKPHGLLSTKSTVQAVMAAPLPEKTKSVQDAKSEKQMDSKEDLIPAATPMGIFTKTEMPSGESVLRLAERTARALLDYARTGDARMLLVVQRHLTAVQDDEGDSPLHLATIHQQPQVVKQLLHVMLSIHDQTFLNLPNDLHQTPLHLAVITKQPLVVELLLRAGADPSIVDCDGDSVIHMATENGDEETLAVLTCHLGLKLAPLINIPNYEGLFPVHLAVLSGSLPCLKLLHSAGANLDEQELKYGRTPLHYATENNIVDLAAYLVVHVDVDAVTYDGNTLLHVAASRGLKAMTMLLMASGADPHAESFEILQSDGHDDDFEKEDEDTDWGLVRGLTPFDVAANQMICDILCGEEYKSAETNQSFSKMSGVTDNAYDSGVETSSQHLIEIRSSKNAAA
uniref:nuclear factor NF-kappa-B p105 subunit-like isoform X2 n=1 Tax=Myxine glutinosa TaxID=7769 RepID=UPI00358F603F